ncbi:hypothetical protein SK128_001006 [Halocaridina rubra]|uniref:Major facilitator superfamily (MFS) profile domain-containing protein n=1 Tax=Halocaridina rubra TaxID=373956 RepID=A0AAN8XHS1_HALRR
MAMDIDGIFRVIGEFGPYQRRIFFLLCLPAVLIGSANLAFVFIAAVPKYRCMIPGCDNATYPVYNAPFVNYTVPHLANTKEWDECHRFTRRNGTITDTCIADDFNSNETEICGNGSVFDESVYTSTIVSEFGLTCHKSWEGNMAQTIFFGGILAGALIAGYIADRIGRMMTIMIGIVGMASFGISTALVSTLNSFNFVRFMTAVMATTVFQTAFILGTEFVGPNYRVFCGTMPQYFFAFGEILLGLISWWIREWRMIQLIISAPVSCFIFYWFFIPESPRWLQARGKHHKALVVMEKIAKTNKKTIPREMLMQQVHEQSRERNDIDSDVVLDPRNVSMLDVLKKPVLCTRMVLMFYIWIVVALVYYGLSLNSVTLGKYTSTAAPFVNFILTSLAEFPGYSMSWYFMSYIGRKYTLMFSLIFAGISCGGAGFAAEYGPNYSIIPFLLGKCFITSAFGTIYVFVTEMFPTRVRSTILGLCSTTARIGAMLAPFSSSLGYVYGPLPMIVFGSLSIVAGVLNIVMPETKDTTLPETISEAIHLGRAQMVSIQESGTSEEIQGLLSEGIMEIDNSDELVTDSHGPAIQDDSDEEDEQ